MSTAQILETADLQAALQPVAMCLQLLELRLFSLSCSCHHGSFYAEAANDEISMEGVEAKIISMRVKPTRN